MYIQENEIKKLQIRSKMLFIFGWIFTLFWGACLVLSLTRDNDMKFAIATFFFVLTMIGILGLWISNWLKNATLEARFIEHVFANDLDGRIEAHELSNVMGKNEKRILYQLKKLKSLCMHGFSIKNNGANPYIELESKKAKCICKNCGGELEKKIYFKGICPYCGSLDIFAQVISGDKLYSIQHVKNESSESYFYITGDADEEMQKKEIFMCMVHGGMMFLNILLIIRGVTSVQEGEAELSIPIFFVVLSILFLYYMMKHYWNFIYIATTRRFSKYAAKVAEPIVPLQAIFVESFRNKYNIFTSGQKDSTEKKKLKVFREIQKRGYSRNCSLIHTDEGFMIGLKRDIKKGICPMCGSPLTSTLHDQCKCNYCGYIIEDAIGKV